MYLLYEFSNKGTDLDVFVGYMRGVKLSVTDRTNESRKEINVRGMPLEFIDSIEELIDKNFPVIFPIGDPTTTAHINSETDVFFKINWDVESSKEVIVFLDDYQLIQLKELFKYFFSE